MKTTRRFFPTINFALINVFIFNLLLPGFNGWAAMLNPKHSLTAAANGFAFTATEKNDFEETADYKKETIAKKTLAVSKSAGKSAGGPGQTESSGFSFSSSDQMVDPFTGDFSYSIPVMDVEGFPIVLNYNSNVGMNDEASWVGLGWNLNVGSVSREMRGIPDDFDGSQDIVRNHHMKPNTTTEGQKYGVIGGVYFKPTTLGKISKIGTDITLLWGKYNNTYTGKGKTFDFNIAGSFSVPLEKSAFDMGPSVALGYSRDTKNGIGVSTSIGLKSNYEKGDGSGVGANLGLSWGSNFNSRSGVTSRSLNLSGGPSNGEWDMPVSTGASWTCGTLTYVPRHEYSGFMSSTMTTVDLTVGKKWLVATAKAGFEMNFYKSDHDSYNNTDRNPAVGYIYTQKANSSKAILDFNREPGQEFSENMKSTSYGFPTYDLFQVSGLGTNGSFRAHRREVGSYGDSRAKIDIDIKSRNGEAGVMFYPPPRLPAIVLGYTDMSGDGESVSGQWEGEKVFNFSSDDAVFYKGIGEMMPVNTELYDYLKKDEPIAVGLTKSSSGDPEIYTTDIATSAVGDVSVSSGNITPKLKPDARAVIYTPRTASSLNTSYDSYTKGIFTPAVVDNFYRVEPATSHLGNHFSAIEVTNTDGTQLNFGVPAYTMKSTSVSFSSSQSSADAQGLVTFTSTENSTDNTSGKSQYFDRTELPAYPSAFLLTSAVSPDYTDIVGDGFTPDDKGSYYKINHSRIFTSASPFNWRFPVNGAFFNEGLLAVDSDNSANYTYGSKEIWYTHSVESKNLIAEFNILERDDVCASAGENGGLLTGNGNRLYKLDKIVLYSLSERKAKGAAATPLQIVEFTYDYSLCLNTPTNKNTAGNLNGANTGKLTLKEIRVYSGEKSEETALAPYIFDYSSVNPNHDYQATDRWGSYNKYTHGSDLPRDLFPYANQDQATADEASSAWKLTKINFPGGSSMEVSYEADSYGFVQNQRAMELAEIKGFTNEIELSYLQTQNSWDGNSRVSTSFQKDMSVSEFMSLANVTNPAFLNLSDIVSGQILSPTSSNHLLLQLGKLPNNVVVFELADAYSGITKADADERFRKEYLKNANGSFINDIYLRSFVDVKSGQGFEQVPTFAKTRVTPVNFPGINTLPAVASSGVMPAVGGQFKYGYVVLQNVLSSDQAKNILMGPVQKTALEFAKLHLDEIVYGTCQNCDGDLQIDRGSFWKRDIYKRMAEYGYCKTITGSLPSQIRLFEPHTRKLGGNGRVKSILISDGWSKLSSAAPGAPGETEGTYQWTYSYDNIRESDGVAAYEPLSGNDENPFYMWDRYTNESVSYPDESRFQVKPTGYMLFPSPIIGYKDVVKTFSADDFGAQTYLFHTAKDFPVKTKSTQLLQIEADKTNFLKTEMDLYGVSQGHSVVTNDFHGKPDMMILSGAFGENLKTVKYRYKNLGDRIKMLDQDGVIYNEQVSLEYDISADTRMVESTTEVGNYGGTILLQLPLFIPCGGSPVIQKYTKKQGFYVHTVNKHVNYSAIVDKIETTDLGSVTVAENLVYDRHTGGVLLSSLNDDFNDPLYSFSYPAYWYYPVFRNPIEQSASPVSGTISSGNFTASASLNMKFGPGDYVKIQGSSGTSFVYVFSVTGSVMSLINDAGAAVTATGSSTVTLVKSGRKNMLDASMASVITKRNPLSGQSTASVFTFPSSDIINVNAITYLPQTSLRCLDGGRISGSIKKGERTNPFRFGAMNTFFVDKQFNVQDSRKYTEINGNRFNGTIQNYRAFYKKGTGSDWFRIDESGYGTGYDQTQWNWRAMGTTTELDEFGRVIEQKDQLGVYSSVLYGFNYYNKILPVAQAINARYFEIAFDGFEDYEYMKNWTTGDNCKGHFEFADKLSASITISNNVRHSGSSSLKVNYGASAIVDRNTTGADCTAPASSTSFVVDDCSCIKPFEPYRGKEYIIGAWVKGEVMDEATNRLQGPEVRVSFQTSPAVPGLIFFPTGEIIDGWQRVEGSFLIPANATKIFVSLTNNSESSEAVVYFDDLRLHPKLSGMTSTVYDPATLLPAATHDGYNFTTFYNYDENLSPVRTRVETKNGIQTVAESEGSSAKKYKQD